MKVEDVKLTCVSEWLPIQYDENGEPFVTYEGNPLWIRDIVRFHERKAHRTIDIGDYASETRFPRFIETRVDGREIRLWKVVQKNLDEEKEAYLRLTLKEIEAKPDVVKALRRENIITIGDLMETPRERLSEIANGNQELETDILYVLNTVEMVYNAE